MYFDATNRDNCAAVLMLCIGLVLDLLLAPHCHYCSLDCSRIGSEAPARLRVCMCTWHIIIPVVAVLLLAWASSEWPGEVPGGPNRPFRQLSKLGAKQAPGTEQGDLLSS